MKGWKSSKLPDLDEMIGSKSSKLSYPLLWFYWQSSYFSRTVFFLPEHKHIISWLNNFWSYNLFFSEEVCSLQTFYLMFEGFLWVAWTFTQAWRGVYFSSHVLVYPFFFCFLDKITICKEFSSLWSNIFIFFFLCF